MLVFRKLLAGLLTSIVVLTAAVGQTSSTITSTAIMVTLQTPAPQERLSQSCTTWSMAKASDSLVARRSFFSTTIRQQGNQLDRSSIRSLLLDYPVAYRLYRQGQWVKPTGPFLIVAGVIISYIAVKGTPKTAYARGIGTPSNPSPPDVLVDYTDRSLPALLSGIGLAVGGLCLIEIANGLTAKSINIYNARALSHQSITGVQTIGFGLTPSGTLGFVIFL